MKSTHNQMDQCCDHWTCSQMETMKIPKSESKKSCQLVAWVEHNAVTPLPDHTTCTPQMTLSLEAGSADYMLTVFLFRGGKWRSVIHLYMPHWSGHLSLYQLFFFSKAQLMGGTFTQYKSTEPSMELPWLLFSVSWLKLVTLHDDNKGLSGLPCTNCSFNFIYLFRTMHINQ